VTLLVAGRRVDVALPVDVALAELVPMVLELAGPPGGGRPPVPWRISGVTGGPLPPDATLDELGVLDGDLPSCGSVRTRHPRRLRCSTTRSTRSPRLRNPAAHATATGPR
jgi:hypothetical protein